MLFTRDTSKIQEYGKNCKQMLYWNDFHNDKKNGGKEEEGRKEGIESGLSIAS